MKKIYGNLWKVFEVVIFVIAVGIVVLHIVKGQIGLAAQEKLRADNYFPQDDQGQYNDSVFAFQQYLEDKGYTDVKFAVYPMTGDTGGHHQILMWRGFWQTHHATISIRTEILPVTFDGISDYTDIQSWITCELDDGSAYATTRAIDQDIVMDYHSPFIMNRSTFESFLGMTLKTAREWGAISCPLEDASVVHCCTGARGEGDWHEAGE